MKMRPQLPHSKLQNLVFGMKQKFFLYFLTFLDKAFLFGK